MFAQNADAVNFCREGRDRMFSQLLRLCREWCTSIPHDFRNDHMRTRLNELLGLCSVDQTFKQKATDLQINLRSTLNKLDKYDKAVKNLHKTLSDNKQRPIQSDILERFSMVGVDEILLALADNDLADLGQNRNGPGCSISFYVEWFNRLSSFAATEVLRQLRKKHRVEVIEFLIDVAKECCEIGNFNSLMAIVAGLSLPAVMRLKKTVIEFLIDVAKECCEIGNFNSLMAIVAGLSLPAVMRLKKTHILKLYNNRLYYLSIMEMLIPNLVEYTMSGQRLKNQNLEILQHQLDPSGNFLSYRATMKAAQWRAETVGSTQKIVIPFFVLLIKDLFLLYHSGIRTLPNGHLNYIAFSQISEQLRSVVKWKTANCTFPKNAAVLQYMLISSLYGEKDLLLASFECETAESAVEREQLKKLKNSS
ncbi:RasGEF domain protein [Dictyocaulus viviparus]|uniref:RasGEF domain protein n=1 Tax=Dictyocaulus viviparus TaxID=29172 RepID=A0A0D8XRW1_DICVI|nr:RasGEF domain protein [Dictyocaulus viviparus]